MNILPVQAGHQRYNVHVGRIEDCRGDLHALAGNGALTVVSDERVWALHGERLSGVLPVDPIFVPPGEAAKDWPNLQSLLAEFTRRNLGRTRPVLAFGGGSIGDLTGLATGLFKRGVPIIHVPTTLLAQADSAVGGKTAIDAWDEKNLIGMFHQPAMVIADVSFLQTLDQRQLRSGYAEVVKYGLIGDPAFFEWLERRGEALLAGAVDVQQEAIWQSVAAKARHVEADVTDRSGVRALLNLGHTFGHAIESAAGLGSLLHGEAVATGIALAFGLSERLGLCPQEDSTRVRDHLKQRGLPTSLAECGVQGQALLPFMRADKKNEGGSMRLVLARGIGRAFLSDGVAEQTVSDFLAEAA